MSKDGFFKSAYFLKNGEFFFFFKGIFEKTRNFVSKDGFFKSAYFFSKGEFLKRAEFFEKHGILCQKTDFLKVHVF